MKSAIRVRMLRLVFLFEVLDRWCYPSSQEELQIATACNSMRCTSYSGVGCIVNPTPIKSIIKTRLVCEWLVGEGGAVLCSFIDWFLLLLVARWLLGVSLVSRVP